MNRVENMANAAVDQLMQQPDIGWAFDPDRAVKNEASLFWRETGIACRARPDIFAIGADGIIHYKTTGMTLNGGMLSRFAAGQGWDVIAAHYGAGVKALTGREPEQYFAIQETAPPHLALVCQLDDAFVGNGAMQRGRAMRTWARCLREESLARPYQPHHRGRAAALVRERDHLRRKTRKSQSSRRKERAFTSCRWTFHKPI